MGNLRAITITQPFALRLTVLGTALVGLGAAPLSPHDPARVVHQFDFDERDEGNLEDVPKYWVQIRPEGFPHYAEGRFDPEIGRDAPPSFYLSGNGRSVAYHYAGPETRVRTNSDYRIEGFIRDHGLETARACLSAHFLDKQGRPLPETLVSSPYIGASKPGAEWTHVEMLLTAAPPEAYSIGLVAWVLQESEWRTDVPPPWHIPRVDVPGGAWFDDITIHRLPRVELGCDAPGNVMGERDAQSLKVLLADEDDSRLRGRLVIADARGTSLERHTVGVVLAENATPTSIDVSYLPPGLYQAELDVFADGRPVLERRLRFARLGRVSAEKDRLARSFGIVLPSHDRAPADTELALLKRQGVHSAKVPVWDGRPDGAVAAIERRRTHRYLQELVNDGFVLTGVFAGPPAPLARPRVARHRRLVELLNEEDTVWHQYLAQVVAPHAGAFRQWQLGADGTAFFPELDALLRTAIGRLREGVRPYVNLPSLVAPAETGLAKRNDSLPVEEISLTIGEQTPTEAIYRLIQDARDSGYQRVSVYLEPLDPHRYQREARLARWARRVITARHAGADAVFVPQTWSVRHTAQGPVTEPDETYVILRTLARVIADVAPGPHIPVADGVRALAFRSPDRAVVALWDEQAGRSFRRHALQLGKAHEHLDLWGRTRALERDADGRQVLALSQTPVLVTGVEPWLLELYDAFSLSPGRIESGTEAAAFTLEIAYSGAVPLTGTVALHGPDGWAFIPHRHSFSILPHRSERLTFQARIPHNDPAGLKRVRADVTLSDPARALTVPLAVQTGLADVRVSALAVLEGASLYLRHVVTNASDEALSFRAAASVPGRERQYRPIANLAPGDTQTVAYRFPDAAELVGRKVQLTLRELGDGPRTHALELIVP